MKIDQFRTITGFTVAGSGHAATPVKSRVCTSWLARRLFKKVCKCVRSMALARPVWPHGKSRFPWNPGTCTSQPTVGKYVLDQIAKLLLRRRTDGRMDQSFLNSILYIAYEAGKVRLRRQQSPAAGILWTRGGQVAEVAPRGHLFFPACFLPLRVGLRVGCA